MRLYEDALKEFEQGHGHFRQAARTLAGLLALNADDGPAWVLMHRAISGGSSPPRDRLRPRLGITRQIRPNGQAGVAITGLRAWRGAAGQIVLLAVTIWIVNHLGPNL